MLVEVVWRSEIISWPPSVVEIPLCSVSRRRSRQTWQTLPRSDPCSTSLTPVVWDKRISKISVTNQVCEGQRT